jgi:hypothetical protein
MVGGGFGVKIIFGMKKERDIFTEKILHLGFFGLQNQVDPATMFMTLKLVYG